MGKIGDRDSATGRFLTGNNASLGRPRGSRNKLGEDFLEALQIDFAQHGIDTIAKVRAERPHEYLKIVASLLPKQIEVPRDVFDGISDESLEAIINAARLALGIDEPGKPN
jgi:hypothetical protein